MIIEIEPEERDLLIRCLKYGRIATSQVEEEDGTAEKIRTFANKVIQQVE